MLRKGSPHWEGGKCFILNGLIIWFCSAYASNKWTSFQLHVAPIKTTMTVNKPLWLVENQWYYCAFRWCWWIMKSIKWLMRGTVFVKKCTLHYFNTYAVPKFMPTNNNKKQKQHTHTTTDIENISSKREAFNAIKSGIKRKTKR